MRGKMPVVALLIAGCSGVAEQVDDMGIPDDGVPLDLSIRDLARPDLTGSIQCQGGNYIITCGSGQVCHREFPGFWPDLNMCTSDGGCPPCNPDAGCLAPPIATCEDLPSACNGVPNCACAPCRECECMQENARTFTCLCQ
jgi:hypothetical protein